jgi:ribonuclease HII
LEQQHLEKGYCRIAGLDEVGRGCLAGPVVAAAVILDISRIPDDVDDSKKLAAPVRQKIALEIRRLAVAYAIGQASPEEIDEHNIFNATKLAMVRALRQIDPAPDLLLIDGNFLIPSAIMQVPVVRGDQISVSIAASSILAKVFRDEFMTSMDRDFPGYGFASNKGYGSKAHRQSLQKMGRCPLHRKTFQWATV